MSETFLIVDLSRTRVSESVVFWRENKHGYTVNFDDAGHYSEADARVIVANPDKDNIAVPFIRCEDVLMRIVPKHLLKDLLKEAL